jgi:hypothetical protein
MARIEYRICDLVEKHAKPTIATYEVEGEEAHDVCEMHVGIAVMAALLSGDIQVVVRTLAAKENTAGGPRHAGFGAGNLVKQVTTRKKPTAIPNDEPCMVCGKVAEYRTGVGSHQWNAHRLRKEDITEFHPDYLAWLAKQPGKEQ